jgi:hypothetical protein
MRVAVLGGLLFFIIGVSLIAQETSQEQLPGGLRERAVIMHVSSRIVEQNQEVVWNSEATNITMPGRPVGLKLVGTDLVVVVQFTPFLRPTGQLTLVAQSQIWVIIPGEGMSFQTAMQTIPLEFGQRVYFFPLGPTRSEDAAHIEIQLILEPYVEDGAARVRQNRQEASPSFNLGRGGPRAGSR